MVVASLNQQIKHERHEKLEGHGHLSKSLTAERVVAEVHMEQHA